MGFFESFFKEKYNWEEVKHSEQAYPINSISLITIKTENVDLTTGWIDKGYEHYSFKKYCPYNFLIIVNLNGKEDAANMQTIEDYFADMLREVCIAHMLARVVSKDSMSIELYLDDQEAGVKQLKAMQEDAAKPASFEWEVLYDPKWKLVKGLMHL